jgi:hypothetical protein
MSLKGGNSRQRKEVKRVKTLNVFKLTLNYTLRDLKIKLLDKFNKNKFKLNLFLT